MALRTRSARLGVVLCALLSACAPGVAEPPPPAARNVLLIVVDTLGAEHVGAYGGAARTPNIDRLARDGVQFDAAIATAPWTQPSIASLFTSLMPTQHGVVKLNDSLSDEPLTLAEALQARGMRTHGVISHVLMLPKYGFAQGFDTYDARGARGHDELSSDVVTDGAIEWLDGWASEASAAPFFLFAHYFDPHYVYRHHPDFPHTKEYDGPVRSSMPIWELRDMRVELDAADMAHLVDLYHEEVAFTDHHIGRLLDRIDELGVADDTLVVFTADHGEEFMRHGWIGHTRTLFDELVRVPLIVRLPGEPHPRRVASPVSSLDVAPTIVRLLGGEPAPGWTGHALDALVRGGEASEPTRFVFSEVSYGPKKQATERRAAEKQAHKTALVAGNLKLVHDKLDDTWQFYDRERDPEELRDLADTVGDELDTLVERLRAFEARLADSARTPEPLDADPAEIEELRKLGYVD